jgi:uncharacterized protein (TIGR00266 family)
MQTRISGTTMPVLEIGLEPGETIVSETGQMAWMTATMQMSTTMGAGSGGGLWGAVKRAVGGGGLFMTEFTPAGGPGAVAFAAKMPGGIMPLEVQPGRGYLVHRHGFLCATRGVELSIALQRSLGAGIFGGDGFILQHLSGTCSAWVELGGEIVSYDLQPGETIQVHPGHVGMFEDSINFDIVTVPGVRNILFGAEGFFLARLTGPGKIWLQTMTAPMLAHSLAPYLGRSGGGGAATTEAAVAGGVGGAVLRDIFGGS